MRYKPINTSILLAFWYNLLQFRITLNFYKEQKKHRILGLGKYFTSLLKFLKMMKVKKIN